jgi:ABC-2 type transport system ATP-binding protein
MPEQIVLETRNLSKKYGSQQAVDDLSLVAHNGEILGFLGPNGAGKTTSIKMMCGLLRPDSGQVFIHGRPVQGGMVETRMHIGVCPQETIVWDKLTCIEQLEFMGEMYALPRKQSRARGVELLELLGLGSKTRELGCNLSGGMRRRLNLALALVHDPDILVLDEPEAGLDPQSRVLVREYVRSLARNKTIILTTHNMDEADRMADRVAIIDQGRLLVADTPASLKRSVGQGDVLEIDMEPFNIRAASALLQEHDLTVNSIDGTIIIRGRGLIDKLGRLLEMLQEAGINVRSTHLRANTLEDVFLSLTGRSLRA